MRDKPRIEKQGDVWRIRMPVIGFSFPEQYHFIGGFKSREEAAHWLEGYRRYRSKPS